jgi:hypothetical protein
MPKFASDEVAAAAKDPVIAAALAARARLSAAFAAQDVDETLAVSAKDLIVNTPANLVARLDTVIAFFKAGRMDYDSVEVIIEGLDGRGDHVVIMGAEVVTPKETSSNPDAGKDEVRQRGSVTT